ncbi:MULTISPECIES: YfhH family protein [Bacillaceae]|uniref:YfhH family protein n=1 Tax=Bacillaceae TaxID=186817 RepID=UPI002A0ECC35|nr:YfhH family protein [Cytobacillus sp. IB215316]MDX8362354.1 YfhH family protein [Cytobacillus sp. IB215316]
MVEKRFSEMSEFELKSEIGSLLEKARKAEQLGMVNEFAVLERKAVIAKAYLLNPEDFLPGEVYELEGDVGVHFVVKYLNGIFVWGNRTGQEDIEEGIPISMLGKKVKDTK